jgi:hypothetical protein
MQQLRSQYVKPARHLACAAALGASVVAACATGVDVTSEELATICLEDPSLDCDGATGAPPGGAGGSGPSGFAGSSSSGRGGVSSGGTFNGNAGTQNAGTSGSNAGTAGNVGAGGTGPTPQPLATGTCLPTDDVVILYRNRSTAGSTNEPSLVLSVENDGAAFDLTQLTIRYWFTADGAGEFTGNIDYANLGGAGSEAVSVSFGQESGSDYAELAFSGGANVATGGTVQEVQLRFHGNPYQNMDQTNDFSYIAAATALVPNSNITPYVNGMQAGGCVPNP